jgi:pilus assembly protein Flp/PilA
MLALLKDESGATAIEYGLIAALVAIAAMGGMRLLGTSLNSIFTSVGTTLQGASSP